VSSERKKIAPSSRSCSSVDRRTSDRASAFGSALRPSSGAAA